MSKNDSENNNNNNNNYNNNENIELQLAKFKEFTLSNTKGDKTFLIELNVNTG